MYLQICFYYKYVLVTPILLSPYGLSITTCQTYFACTLGGHEKLSEWKVYSKSSPNHRQKPINLDNHHDCFDRDMHRLWFSVNISRFRTTSWDAFCSVNYANICSWNLFVKVIQLWLYHLIACAMLSSEELTRELLWSDLG